MFDLLRLNELFPQDTPPEYHARLQAVDRYHQELLRTCSMDFLDAYWSEVVRLFGVLEDQAFIRGLRLGAQLALGLTAPLSTPRTPCRPGSADTGGSPRPGPPRSGRRRRNRSRDRRSSPSSSGRTSAS